MRNIDACFTLLEFTSLERREGRISRRAMRSAPGRAPACTAISSRTTSISRWLFPSWAEPTKTASGPRGISITFFSVRYRRRPTSSSTCPPRPASPTQDKAEIRKWLDWGRKNIEYLKVRKDLPDWPAAGKVDGSAHIVGQRGFVFLFNPSQRSAARRVCADRGEHRTRRNGATGLASTIRPRIARCGKDGETIRWNIPGQSVVVLENSAQPQCDGRGNQMTVNLVATCGQLKVELQDASGKPIPGFTLTDSTAVRGDGVAPRPLGRANATCLAGRSTGTSVFRVVRGFAVRISNCRKPLCIPSQQTIHPTDWGCVATLAGFSIDDFRSTICSPRHHVKQGAVAGRAVRWYTDRRTGGLTMLPATTSRFVTEDLLLDACRTGAMGGDKRRSLAGLTDNPPRCALSRSLRRKRNSERLRIFLFSERRGRSIGEPTISLPVNLTGASASG